MIDVRIYLRAQPHNAALWHGGKAFHLTGEGVQRI